MSGGVACNDYVKRGLDLICQELNYKLLIPSKHLCVDNGVMIAWNGVEKWRAGIDLIQPSNLDSVDIEPKYGFSGTGTRQLSVLINCWFVFSGVRWGFPFTRKFVI